MVVQLRQGFSRFHRRPRYGNLGQHRISGEQCEISKPMMTRKTWQLFLLLAWLPPAAHARVVINEIFYHAPDDVEDLEYIEVHNSSDQPVDLGGWEFTRGIKFKFPPGTQIKAKGFLVLCRNRERFKEYYDAPVAGVFDRPLSNKGERVELS